MSKVYIIVGSIHYSHDNVIACFDSKKAAMEYVENESGYDSYDVCICGMNDEADGGMTYEKGEWTQLHSTIPLEV